MLMVTLTLVTFIEEGRSGSVLTQRDSLYMNMHNVMHNVMRHVEHAFWSSNKRWASAIVVLSDLSSEIHLYLRKYYPSCHEDITQYKRVCYHHQLVYSVFDCGSNSAYRRSGVRNGLLQRLVHRSREGERSHVYGRGGDWKFGTSPCCQLRRTQFHGCKTQPLLTLAAGSTRHATTCNKDDGFII